MLLKPHHKRTNPNHSLPWQRIVSVLSSDGCLARLNFPASFAVTGGNEQEYAFSLARMWV